MTQPDLHKEHAELLMKKAAEDEALLDEVKESPRVSDEVFGFHCQQAAEKMLKAVLAVHQVVYRRTHDLDELLTLLVENNVLVPSVAGQLSLFTAFAVEYRYDVWPEHAPYLDREASRDVIHRLREWADHEIHIAS